jgi:hypothetical protein
MIVLCRACSAQNFVSPERLAVREIPPRCWECGRTLEIFAAGADTERESPRSDPESNGDAGNDHENGSR